MPTDDIPVLSVADIDRVLPAGYQVLSSNDPHNEEPHALRAVRNEASAQIRYFSRAQEYLQFALSVAPQGRLAEQGGTRYLLLSAQYDADPWFHASVTHTVAALTRSSVILHRMKSDETSVRFVLSREEMAALIAGYRSYLAECEREEVPSPAEFDPFLADAMTEQES